MSHFAVLCLVSSAALAAADGDVRGAVDNMLEPFHEFECTGMDNEFVQDIDITDETREEYMTRSTSKVWLGVGQYAEESEDRFWHPATSAQIAAIVAAFPEEGIFGTNHGRPDEAKSIDFRWKRTSSNAGDRTYTYTVFGLPEGAEVLDVPYKDLMSFHEYCVYCGYNVVPHDANLSTPELREQHKAKHSHALVEDVADPKSDVVKVINRTNPDAKWDWYVVGGRWKNHLYTKDGGVGDILPLAEWGFEDRVEQARVRFGGYYDIVKAALDAHPATKSWEQVRADYTTGEGDNAKLDIDGARTFYNDQPGVLAARACAPSSL